MSTQPKDDAGHDWAAHLRELRKCAIFESPDLKSFNIPFASYVSEMRVSARRATTTFYIGRYSWRPPEPPRPVPRTRHQGDAATEGDRRGPVCRVRQRSESCGVEVSLGVEQAKWIVELLRAEVAREANDAAEAPATEPGGQTFLRELRPSRGNMLSTQERVRRYVLGAPVAHTLSGRREPLMEGQLSLRSDLSRGAVARTLISTFGVDLRHILDAAIWLSTPGWEVERPDAIASALRYLSVGYSESKKMGRTRPEGSYPACYERARDPESPDHGEWLALKANAPDLAAWVDAVLSKPMLYVDDLGHLTPYTE